jgi:acyl-homoserine-lactone acylase
VFKVDAYPSYMAPLTPMAFRPQRSARMLMSDSALTLDSFVLLKHSTRAELADHVLDSLLVIASRGSERVRRASDVLRAWDRTADAESRGGVLFEAFWREYAARVAAPARFAVPWRAGAPLATPAGLGNATAALDALDSAAVRVERTFGALDVKWGAVHRLRRDTVNLPASGGPGTLGVFRVLDYETNAKGDTLTASGGDSFVAAIEFSRPVRARALLGYGNASQPGSPHRVDQLPLLARQELRPVWRTKEEVLKNLEAREWF